MAYHIIDRKELTVFQLPTYNASLNDKNNRYADWFKGIEEPTVDGIIRIIQHEVLKNKIPLAELPSAKDYAGSSIYAYSFQELPLNRRTLADIMILEAILGQIVRTEPFMTEPISTAGDILRYKNKIREDKRAEWYLTVAEYLNNTLGLFYDNAGIIAGNVSLDKKEEISWPNYQTKIL